MAAAWPASLKQCPQTWAATPRDNQVRTAVDVGLSKTRRRYTAVINDIAVSVTMTLADYRTFLDWYENTISQGADNFEYKDPVSGAVQTYHFRAPPQADIIKGRAARVVMSWESVP